MSSARWADATTNLLYHLHAMFLCFQILYMFAGGSNDSNIIGFRLGPHFVDMLHVDLLANSMLCGAFVGVTCIRVCRHSSNYQSHQIPATKECGIEYTNSLSHRRPASEKCDREYTVSLTESGAIDEYADTGACSAPEIYAMRTTRTTYDSHCHIGR